LKVEDEWLGGAESRRAFQESGVGREVNGVAGPAFETMV
jgi:hypothetical protein